MSLYLTVDVLWWLVPVLYSSSPLTSILFIGQLYQSQLWMWCFPISIHSFWWLKFCLLFMGGPYLPTSVSIGLHPVHHTSPVLDLLPYSSLHRLHCSVPNVAVCGWQLSLGDPWIDDPGHVRHQNNMWRFGMLCESLVTTVPVGTATPQSSCTSRCVDFWRNQATPTKMCFPRFYYYSDTSPMQVSEGVTPDNKWKVSIQVQVQQ